MNKHLMGFIVVLVIGILCFGFNIQKSHAQEQPNATLTISGSDSSKVQLNAADQTSLQKRSATLSDEPGFSCKTVDFEGVGDQSPIPEFDGILSPNWLGIIDQDAGGTGNFAFEPSPSTIAFWLGGDSSTRLIQFTEGVAEVSFFYASAVTIQLDALDEKDNVLTSVTGPPNYNTGPGGDPNGNYNKWDPITIKSDGNQIRTVKVIGQQNQTGIDDLKVCKKIGINSVEFTQAIQELQPLKDFKADIASDKTPPVPIVANKPLALRVYMEEVDTSTNVTVKLSGVKTEEKTVTLQPNCSAEDSRYQRNGCQSVDFYFTPPSGDWTATVKTFDKDGNEIESHDFALTSVSTKVLTLRAVSVCDSKFLFFFWNCADADDLGPLLDFLRRTAPTDQVRIEYTGHKVRRDSSSYSDGTQWWVDVARDINNLGTEQYYYGMVRPNAPTTIGGIAHDIPSRGAASRTSVVRLGTETNDQVVAHETGHMLGRRHTNVGVPSASGGGPPGCYSTATDSGTDWPYSDNRIQSGSAGSAKLEVGFDVDNKRAIDPQNTYDWMSYCIPRWVSPHTYRNALNTLQVTASAAHVQELLGDGTFWKVSGFIKAGVATLDSLFSYETTASVEAGTGLYRIEVRNASDSVLFTRNFTPAKIDAESPEPGNDILTPVFSELIPVQPDAIRIIVIEPGNTEIGSITLEGKAPVATIIAPHAGATLSGTQTIVWAIDDSDSAEHTSWVQYSPDNGNTWQTLALALPDNSLTLDWSQISGSSGQSIIRVFVSDGVNSSMATSGTFSVPKKGVSATILFPPNGSAFRKGDLVHLIGDTYDPEDGASATVLWTSNINGILGSDKQLPVTTLSDGTHTITFTAQDSDGNKSLDVVNVLVDSIAPTLTLSVTLDGVPASCVDINIDARDPVSGAGLDEVEYSFDGGNTWISIELDRLPIRFRAPGTGFFHLIARAADRAGNTAIADERFFIDVACPNEIPQGDAGGEYVALEGSQIVVSGSGSVDPDGSIILYQWDLDNDGEFDDAMGITTTTAFSDNGTYTVGLKVIDNNNATATDTAQIVVSNVAPSVEAGPNVSATQGITLGLTSIAYFDAGSADTHVAVIDWGDGITNSLFANNGVVQAVHVYEQADKFVAKVCITDDDGGTGCDTVIITVELPNEAPHVDAGTEYIGLEGSVIRLDGSASTDTDGSISLYEWDLDNDGQFDDRTGITATVSYQENGSYFVALKATDNDGDSAFNIASIKVNNVAPTVEAGQGVTTTEGLTVSLNAITYFDPGKLDTHTASLKWGDGTNQSFAVANGVVNASHTYVSAGTYTVEICITDDDGGMGCDTLRIVVTPAQKLIYLPLIHR